MLQWTQQKWNKVVSLSEMLGLPPLDSEETCLSVLETCLLTYVIEFPETI